MRKITMVVLPLHGTANVRGIGSNRNREFKIGSPCDGAFGGGAVTSMVEDLTKQAIIITKGFPFAGPVDGQGKREVFDEICVPFASTAYWTVSDEKQEEPPAAKPAQNQQQGQQRR